MGDPAVLRRVATTLAAAGCLAADEEAGELLDAAGGDDDLLRALVERRTSGEPLAWVTGSTTFLGRRVVVEEGVYVPRRQTEALARRAIELLPGHGLAADLCTGSGAVAMALARARPGARVVATDNDPRACSCALANGVEAYVGDLDEPLGDDIRGRCDVMVAVVPYVPTDRIAFLPRDAREHEPLGALDGGPDGVRVLERAVGAAARLLRPGGTVLLELGGDQDRVLAPALAAAHFGETRRLEDADGDLRGVEAVLVGAR